MASAVHGAYRVRVMWPSRSAPLSAGQVAKAGFITLYTALCALALILSDNPTKHSFLSLYYNSPLPWNLPDPHGPGTRVRTSLGAVFCRPHHPSAFVPRLFLMRRDLFLLEEMFHVNRKDYSIV